MINLIKFVITVWFDIVSIGSISGPFWFFFRFWYKILLKERFRFEILFDLKLTEKRLRFEKFTEKTVSVDQNWIWNCFFGKFFKPETFFSEFFRTKLFFGKISNRKRFLIKLYIRTEKRIEMDPKWTRSELYQTKLW